MRLPHLREINAICSSEELTIEYLLAQGVFNVPDECLNCHGSVFYRYGKIFRCSNRKCRKQHSICKNTFFSSVHLSINDTLLLGYCWLAKMSYETLLDILHNSSATVTTFTSHFRQLVADSLDFEDLIIGGENVIVEVDEAKFGKRKFNRGHHVEGCWILGGVERTPERKAFLVEVSNRRAETLLNVISTYVNPGSIVYTDCFRSYSNLSDLFEHYSVNHSINFVDPITGVHTNTIEGTWNGVKLRIRPRSRVSGSIDLYLAEFLWRRRKEGNLWSAFIEALKEVEF